LRVKKLTWFNVCERRKPSGLEITMVLVLAQKFFVPPKLVLQIDHIALDWSLVVVNT
jgi:hypothetical protein